MLARASKVFVKSARQCFKANNGGSLNPCSGAISLNCIAENLDLNPPVTIEWLKARLAQNHFTNWMGLEILSAGDGAIEMIAPWREEFISNPDRRFTHGGILAALIDTAGSFAVATRLGRPPQTVDMRVDYHRAAMPGALAVTGRIVRLGRTLATSDAYIFDTEKVLLASGRAVFLTSDVPPSSGSNSLA